MLVMVASRGLAAQEVSSKGFAPIPDRPGDFGVALDVAGGKTTFKVGDALSLRFKCSQPGFLTLISIDSAGDAVLMFPNKWTPDSKVSAGQWIEVPGDKSGFRLIARPPLGTTYVRAFVTSRPLASIEGLRDGEESIGMSSLGRKGDDRLSRVLREIKGFEPEPDEKPGDPPAMAIVTLRFTITDDTPRRADGKILGEIPEGADLDRLTPDAAPKAKLLAALRDEHIWYVKNHEEGLAIPPTFSFDSVTGSVEFAGRTIIAAHRTEEAEMDFLVEPGDAGGTEIERLRSMQIRRVKIGGPADLAAARLKLRNEGAKSVQPVVYYHAFGSSPSAEPMIKLQWALKNDFFRAADTGTTAALEKAVRRPVVVAVVDTGMAADHPDLGRALYHNAGEVPGNDIDDDENGFVDDVSGFDFVEMKAGQLVGARDNHGTFVASVIAARADGKGVMGVCPWAEILPVRAGGLDGTFATPAIVRALLYAADRGARIVNCSWGGYGNDPAIYRAMEVLREKGVLIVCAAGNEANDNDVRPATPASYDLDNVMSVAAMRVDGELASFSNWGAGSVHLAAPGELIVGYPDASGDVSAWDGTSFAAPMVAGAAALIWAKHPDWDYLRVKNAILASVRKSETLSHKTVSGGMLDVAALLKT